MKRALDARERVRCARLHDRRGHRVRQSGELTLALAQRHVDQIVTVSEESWPTRSCSCSRSRKPVVEGAGAAPLAAL